MNNYPRKPTSQGQHQTTQRKPSNKKKVNWSGEVASSAKIAGKVVGRIFSYVLNVLLTVLLICFITGIIVVTVFAVYVKNYIDPEIDPSLFKMNASQTTKIFYMDYSDRENRIGEMIEIEDQRLYGSQNSMWVSYTEIPEDLVNAFVAIEDHRFWNHSGVDWWRTCGAILNYFIPFDNKFGGSTITQQTIKNLTEDDDYTPQRKIQEILRALNLEKKLDKTQIMELYLNNIYLSQNCIGVQAAAWTYFGKEVKDLTLLECAAIAGITQAPTKYDPVQNPESQTTKRNTVLAKMLEYGYITQAEYDENYNKELDLNYQGRAQSVKASTNSWYTDQVIEEVVAALCAEKGYSEKAAYDMIYSGGLQIITLQDPDIQDILEEVYTNDANFPKTNNAIQPQSSFVVIDHATGDVVGLIGARGEKEGNLLLNYATQTTRSPGSSIKPLSIYAPALEKGIITYGSVYDDVPVWFNYADDDEEKLNPSAWPKNLPEVYNGLTTVQDAVTRSVNTVAVRILQDLTLDASFDFVRNKLNMTSYIEYATLSNGMGITDKDYSALALGGMNYGVTNLEITAAYQVFANGGVYNKPRTWLKVLDSEGNLLLENESESYVVISEQTASIMTKMLQNVVTRGTAKAVTLQKQINCAGKTGTASNDVDRWFIGYTPYYVGGIWFGYEMPQSLGTLSFNPVTTGWDIVMTKIHEEILNSGKSLKTFETADGVIKATYCKDSGKLMTSACYLDPRGSRAEEGYFTAATVPTETCDRHVLVNIDTSTGAIANEYCPSESVVQKGLLKLENGERVFPMNVKVTDAQYTYMEVSADTPMPESGDVPFYINLYEEGTYPGYTNTNGNRVYNSYCYEHHYVEPEPEETTTPEEDSDIPPDESGMPEDTGDTGDVAA
ncbi:MAG: transglycosylase domain-containing protein [Clostridia bacterium]|nr:transglycosylase domain-containing protein [Clostridia bacterium]